ncbi:AAL168Cp [Eremothecium gossypii ATCC 10895]|uniref:Cytochrome c oxidase assembly protein COX16, mitochondrial n=1 Tax=Eremothecium gossypii (strain ATCC 10895 / CBS 109.51 / FGSC 9923 / NRRL Y-1056) TaxID=284811 RepID=COX16_EREGS|nr:AAL168Cp [Eremothecium gossypii ATCC 10895]Q75FA7.1 RecName: Full=Cytochrome c oxidase assembly protein COX16, mitochondrial; Flags: Precursor [Eremothecium gossypii ATCC 10895]AAS50198.1 AAL168Cp [Eremothecium gossypii ATCC 10895]AEY94483.1 FAAL168Cp [Eremothecium gossypii FDAG1]
MSLGSRTFRSKRQMAAFEKSLQGRYLKLLRRNPFLFYGVPFCTLMAVGSYCLSDFTAVKYEREDKKVRSVQEDELVKLRANRRTVDLKEEFYRLQGLADQDWEPVRVPRLPGESENVWDVE